MKCSKCGEKTQVVDSKYMEDMKVVRRRRVCVCGTTFFTAEKVYRTAPTRKKKKKRGAVEK